MAHFIAFLQRISWDPKSQDQELCLLKGKQEVSYSHLKYYNTQDDQKWAFLILFIQQIGIFRNYLPIFECFNQGAQKWTFQAVPFGKLAISRLYGAFSLISSGHLDNMYYIFIWFIVLEIIIGANICDKSDGSATSSSDSRRARNLGIAPLIHFSDLKVVTWSFQHWAVLTQLCCCTHHRSSGSGLLHIYDFFMIFS